MDPVTIASQHMTVTVSPLGAEMEAITTSDGREWLWHGDPAFWSGRAPILFPMVGRAPEDHITIAGERYPMAQHGFARRSRFVLVGERCDWCRFELAASEASRAIYPFDFRLAVEYRVSRRAVAVMAEVTNRNDRPMPFGIGFHPAFVWPLPGRAGADHLVRLDGGREPELARLEAGLVRPERQPSPFNSGLLRLDHALFDADAMLFPEGAGEGLFYTAGDTGIRLTWQNLPNLALWSKPGAGFICLEPWHGTAAEAGGSAELAERPYAVLLPPGASARYGYAAEMIG